MVQFSSGMLGKLFCWIVALSFHWETVDLNIELIYILKQEI
jgi:hypothetical protein